jgi:transcriptional regulator with XRE-family HTH domain
MEPNKFMIKAGQHVFKVRKALGLTQEDFAKLVNKTHPRSPDLKVTRMLVSKHERADVKMPTDKYLKYLSLNPADNPLD